MSISIIGSAYSPIPPPAVDQAKLASKDADGDQDADPGKESAAQQSQETGLQALALPVDPNRGRNLDISV